MRNNANQQEAKKYPIVCSEFQEEANCHFQKRLVIEECVYYVHPVYNFYAASRDGQIIHIVKQLPNNGNKQHNGYVQCSVCKYEDKNTKTYKFHRFVWECFHGIIPDNKVIDYINDNREDNRLCNLQIMTKQENCKKSAKKRDYAFAVNNHENKRCIKATNQTTQTVVYFKSMYAAQKELSINDGIVKMVCEGINRCKTGNLKKMVITRNLSIWYEKDLKRWRLHILMVKVLSRESRITKPYLTKYERIPLLARRSQQLFFGAQPMIKDVGNLCSLEIAKLELEYKIIPLVIERPLPGNVVEN